MSENNNKTNRFIPLIIALSLIVGFFLSLYIFPVRTSIKIPFIETQTETVDYNKFNEVLQHVKNKYVDSSNCKRLEEIAIISMLDSLDPHSSYITKEDLKRINESMQGNFEGIGVQFRIDNDTVCFTDIIAEGPSEKAIRVDKNGVAYESKASNIGLRDGDRLICVDDSIVAGVGVTNEMVISMLRGPKGEKVQLGVKRKTNEEILYYVVTRDVIPTKSLRLAYMINDTIGFIALNAFTRTSGEEFQKGLKELKRQGMNSLILDLRGNGGGYLYVAVEILSELLTKGSTIVYTEGLNRKKEELFVEKNGMFTNGKLLVLVDETSASASEIVAGAIQDHDRGIVMGRRSFGKGLVQDQIDLKDSSAIRLTVARYYTPSGRCIQRPYNNGKTEYYHEYIDRFMSGELINADSIHIADTNKKYYTRLGRVVYGGGGIIPDEFIAIKTYDDNKYFFELLDKSIIFDFAFDYVDEHRNKLKEKFPSAKEFIDNFETTTVMLDSICSKANKAEISFNDIEFDKTRKDIMLLNKAYIGRELYNDEAFLPIFNLYDTDVQQALNYFSKQNKEYKNEE